MLEMIDIGVPEAVAYRVGGKITEAEMKSVFSIFKEKIDKGEKLLVYQEVDSVGGAELDAIIEKMKFMKEMGLSHFERIAVLSPGKWIPKLVDLEGKLFKSVTMKGFSMEEKSKAVEFLKEGLTDEEGANS